LRYQAEEYQEQRPEDSTEDLRALPDVQLADALSEQIRFDPSHDKPTDDVHGRVPDKVCRSLQRRAA